MESAASSGVVTCSSVVIVCSSALLGNLLPANKVIHISESTYNLHGGEHSEGNSRAQGDGRTTTQLTTSVTTAQVFFVSFRV